MKVFWAKIQQGQILIDAPKLEPMPVIGSGIQIIGQGGDSNGVLVISENEAAYIPNTTPDLAQDIDIVINGFNSVISALNAISGGVLPSNAGGAITTGGFTSGIKSGVSGINEAISALNNLKKVLK